MLVRLLCLVFQGFLLLLCSESGTTGCKVRTDKSKANYNSNQLNILFFWGGEKNTPTICSLYKLGTYREAIQKFAFKQALETLTKLPEQPKPKRIKHESSYGTWYTEESQEFLIKAHGPILNEVVAYPYSFSFRLRMISVNYKNYGEPDHWHFEVEEKIYTDATTAANSTTTEAALQIRRNR